MYLPIILIVDARSGLFDPGFKGNRERYPSVKGGKPGRTLKEKGRPFPTFFVVIRPMLCRNYYAYFMQCCHFFGKTWISRGFQRRSGKVHSGATAS